MANLIIVVNPNYDIVVIYYFALIFPLCRMCVLKKTVEYVCAVIIVLKLKSFSEKQEVNTTYNPYKHLNPSSLCFMQEPFPQISTPVTVGCRITIHGKLQLRS